MTSKKRQQVLFIDNGAYEIRSVLDGKVLPAQPNIAFKVPSSLSGGAGGTGGAAAATGGGGTYSSTVLGDNDNSSAASTLLLPQWIIGDEVDRAPFSVLSRCRGKRPLGLGSILADAPLQARIWRRLLYVVAGLHSEIDIDLVVTVQPGTPTESAVLWYTLCFVLFKFNSVTFVVSGWVDYLGSTAVFSKTKKNSSNATMIGEPSSETTATKRKSTAKQQQQQQHQQHHATCDKKTKQHHEEAEVVTEGCSSSRPSCFADTSAFVVDIGFSGTSSFAIVNHLPRRRGFLRQHIGMFHVGIFLARLVSFSQMNLLRTETPDLLVHRGLLEKTLQVDPHSHHHLFSSETSSPSSIHDHLLKWEKAWQNVTSTTKLEKANTFFQGTIRRRLRARDVQEATNPAPPPPLSTVRFVLPTGDEDEMEETATERNSSSSSKNKKRKTSGNHVQVTTTKCRRTNFGYIFSSSSGKNKKNRKSIDDEDYDDEEEEEEDSSDDEGQQKREEEDLAIIKLDHERFIASELLFCPQFVVGDTSVSGRLAGAFGSSSNSVMSALMSSSAAFSTTAAGAATAAAASSLSSSSKIQQQRGAGCVDLLVETRRRFAPELVADMMESIVVTGGGSRIKGFVERFANEVQSEMPPNKQQGGVEQYKFVVHKSTSSSCSSDDTREGALSRKINNNNNNTFDLLPAFESLSTLLVLLQQPPSSLDTSNNDNSSSPNDSSLADVASFLKKCRVVRSADIDAKFEELGATTSKAKITQAHEAAVDRVFAAMQSVLA